VERWQEILQSIDWPTDAVCLDFETYFDKDYALPKMSTVEYVADPRFQFTGLSVKVLDGSHTKFFGGSEVGLAIRLLQKAYGKCLHNCTLIVTNAKFDVLILLEKFGITPPFVIDVQDLGRYYDARMSQKVKDLAKTFNLPAKGDTDRFKGLHWGDMDYPMRKELKEYANRDADIEVDLFRILLPEIDNPMFELKLARHTLKMYLNPIVVLDAKKANDLADKMDTEVANILKAVGCTPKELRGEQSFIRLLRAALPDGEDIPFKKGKKKMILALAKNDDACKELLNHPVEAVVNLIQARLGVKSWPLHINRVRRLVAQSSVCNGKLRVPLKYYAGHTGRWGGEEKINPQNFGGKGRGKAINKLIGQVRECLTAPVNYSFLIADSAQIEARVLAWLAEQNDLTQGFANGEDIYSEFASVLFGSKVYKPKSDDNSPEAKIVSIQRGFGKDAILGAGYGMGKDTFFERCMQNDDLRPLFNSGQYDKPFIKRLIDTYRAKYTKIPELWGSVERAFKHVIKYSDECTAGHNDCLNFSDSGNGTVAITLPSGRRLLYHDAHLNKDGSIRYRGGNQKFDLWGGSIIENVVQSISRDLLGTWILETEVNHIPVVLHCHDEIVGCVSDEKVESCSKTIKEIMTTSPMWGQDLPLATEVCIAKEYKK